MFISQGESVNQSSACSSRIGNGRIGS